MYKCILTVLTALSFNQFAHADQERIWDCVDPSTLKSDQSCVANNFEVNAFNTEFFNELAYRDFTNEQDAFASITFHRDKNIITIKALDIDDKSVLFANQ